MAEQTLWLDGQAKVPGIVEKICPKRHITQNQWLGEWNEMYLNDKSKHCYDFISDYECIFNHPFKTSKYFDLESRDKLQAAKQQGTRISIANLAHFTERKFADGIIKSGGFRGGIKKYNEHTKGDDVKAQFIAELRDEDDGGISDQFHGDGSDQDDEKDSDQKIEEGSEENDNNDQDSDPDNLTQLLKQFATPEAFNRNEQRYGKVYFQYDINDLFLYYGAHFNGEVQFKVLGTFGYKKEVMHAVLVCSQENGADMFRAYPPVLTPEEDVNNEAVVTRDDNGNWAWKPQATGTVIKRLPDHNVYPMYRRWEHVAFAFHIPDDQQFMFVPELSGNLHQI